MNAVKPGVGCRTARQAPLARRAGASRSLQLPASTMQSARPDDGPGGNAGRRAHLPSRHRFLQGDLNLGVSRKSHLIQKSLPTS